MRVILKGIDGIKHEYEVAAEATVHDIKKLMEDEYTLESLRICYDNRVLEDSMTMEGLGMRDRTVLVFVGRKHEKKTMSTATDVATKPSEGSARVSASSQSGQVNVESVPQSTATEVPQSVAHNPPSASSTETNPMLQGVDPALIDTVVSMGFEDRTQVALALRAAYMNVDRAVEFLCSGIPSNVERDLGPVFHDDSQHGMFPIPSSTAPAAPTEGSGSALEQALMAVPRFEEIREIVRANPQAIASAVQQLQLHYPDVARLVQQNPQEFATIMLRHGAAGHVPQAESGEHESMDLPPTISVSDGERAAVDRLVALGGGMWNEYDAIEAYRACEQDENAAAHFLLSNHS
ncbi:putative UV excision repair RAD23 protein [Trypanosoma vivax]|nr:putative UV excision repair RAD23 protein [Trypanosoma vivax]